MASIPRISTNERVQAFAEELLRAGWTIESGGRHKKLVSPTGNFKHAIPGTPSDHRAALNWISQVRKRAVARAR